MSSAQPSSFSATQWVARHVEASGQVFRTLGEQTVAQLKSHTVLMIACVVFFACSAIANVAYGFPVVVSFWPYFTMIFGLLVPIALVVGLPLHCVYMMVVQKPVSPFRAARDFYGGLIFDTRRWARFIPAVLVMMLAFAAYSDMKNLIPIINPFCWDQTLFQVDRWLHGGRDPWLWLQPLLGGSWATQGINFVYNVWFFVMLFFWLSAALTHRDHGWERQFLLSFVLTWFVGGSLLATVFSSMGPVYYDLAVAGATGADNPYAAQMTWLKSINDTNLIWALSAQDMLREAYLNPTEGAFSGISAMPSMHNGSSTLFVLAAFCINRRFGCVMLAFLATIVIGSVHLAWHYAVDAYAGILVALLMWFVAGWLTRCNDRFWERRDGRLLSSESLRLESAN